jgi:glycosyltransferase involved in cell wall biosynthesis
MKIALVHDYIKEYGGAERVLMALHEMWPEAPIYTAFCDKGSTAGKEFKDAKVVESVFAPIIKHWNLYSPLRFLTPLIWKSFDLSAYDLVITSSSWYITRGFRVGKNTKVICYCHTPPRYLYGYQTSIEWQRYWPVRVYALIVNHFLRMFDFSSAQQVNFFIANSKNVHARIKKFYRKDSEVIYPPVDVEKIIKTTKNLMPKNYYLITSRIVGAKGVELAMKLAKEAKIHIKIVGEKAGLKWLSGSLDELRSSWVELVGRVGDEDLYHYYGECKAFLALAKEEDFGITPVEAMAAGRPVIAYHGGGYLETVVDGKTGVFFDELTTGSLIKAIRRLNRLKIGPGDCQKQAKKFSKERFISEIRNFVNSKIKS